jgi:hypothetical protein
MRETVIALIKEGRKTEFSKFDSYFIMTHGGLNIEKDSFSEYNTYYKTESKELEKLFLDATKDITDDGFRARTKAFATLFGGMVNSSLQKKIEKPANSGVAIEIRNGDSVQVIKDIDSAVIVVSRENGWDDCDQIDVEELHDIGLVRSQYAKMARPLLKYFLDNKSKDEAEQPVDQEDNKDCDCLGCQMRRALVKILKNEEEK